MLILEVEDVSKGFAGLHALWNVGFTLNEQEILGLIGPNGSGKTTLFNLITGFLKPDKGRIRFKGRDITNAKPHTICHIGIARTFQIVKPFAHLSTLQNVMVGRIYGRYPAQNMRKAEQESREILEYIGLGGKELIAAHNLTLADRKRVELGRALATKPELLLLDEIMAGLNPTETQDTMHLIKMIRDSGVTLIVVEHVMRAVLGISDRLVVLNVGEKIAEGNPQQIVSDKQVIEAYLGEESYA
jgi:branched-chain amino acid transport system ATP-binding protein